MKKRILSMFLAALMVFSILPVTAFADGEIAIDATTFPDANFLAIVADKTIDADEDGKLSAEEIAAVTTLDVSEKSIASLVGVEKFTALTSLKCAKNALTELDVSALTGLTELDCSGNTALTVLKCGGNKLTSLSVSTLTELTTLDCSSNAITALDLSNNEKLASLKCSETALTELDVSKCTVLTNLICDKCKIAKLNVSGNDKLDVLKCAENALTSLDVSKCTALTGLYCGKNALTSLDLSKNTELTILDCKETKLLGIDLSKNDKLVTTNFDKVGTAITVAHDGTIALSKITGLDATKASDWDKATVKDDVLTVTKDAAAVTYKYSTNNEKVPFMTVTLSVTFEKPSVSFTDVAKDSWYTDAVDWAIQKEITNGMGNNKFEPTTNCIRAQVVTFLWRAAGSPEPAAGTKNPFKDVAEKQYYTKAVLWAVEKGITKGVSETEFNPGGVCTRAQIVTMMYRAAGSPTVTNTTNFKDVVPDSWYAKPVLWAVEKNITKGTGDDKFEPDTNCTRAHAVTFLYRQYK